MQIHNSTDPNKQIELELEVLCNNMNSKTIINVGYRPAAFYRKNNLNNKINILLKQISMMLCTQIIHWWASHQTTMLNSILVAVSLPLMLYQWNNCNILNFFYCFYLTTFTLCPTLTRHRLHWKKPWMKFYSIQLTIGKLWNYFPVNFLYNLNSATHFTCMPQKTDLKHTETILICGCATVMCTSI